MPAVVIGYGNTLRSDDGAGPEVVEAVAALELPGVRALIVPQLTPELTAVLAEAHLAVFVDACIEPEIGSGQILPVRAARRPESLGHTSDPGALLALTEAVFGACPPAWIVRVCAVSFQFGIGLSPTTRRGCSVALQEIVRLIASADSENGKAGDQSFLPAARELAAVGWADGLRLPNDALTPLR